jgi:hypothetical protein
LIRAQVDVRITSRIIEMFHHGKRVAAHQRRYGGPRHGTDPDHMPSAHRRYAAWSPERFQRWARSIGPNTEGLVVAVLANRPHSEQGFRTCLGVLRLFRGLNPVRAEAVADRALAIGALTYKSVASILKNNLDRAPQAAESSTVIEHQNLRGPGYIRRRRGGDTLWRMLDDGRSSKDHISAEIVRQLNAFRDYLNAQFGTPETPVIPLGPDSKPWRITTRQFRRTVAWHIANRPFGTVADMIQYKHASIAAYEGYAGTSRSGFRNEVERERALGQLDDVLSYFERHRAREVLMGRPPHASPANCSRPLTTSGLCLATSPIPPASARCSLILRGRFTSAS